MGNVISGKTYSDQGRVEESCCGFSLRTGTIIIGWSQLIFAAMWIVHLPLFGKLNVEVSFLSVGSIILLFLGGLFTLVGVYTRKLKMLWIAVYILFFFIIWSIIVFILFFEKDLWISVIITVVQGTLLLYSFFVARSYAFEMNDLVVPVNRP
ncbi:UNVERIFIED_CONTAM: hypothetical protein RMT77_005444 [Armadillidium vulgare]